MKVPTEPLKKLNRYQPINLDLLLWLNICIRVDVFLTWTSEYPIIWYVLEKCTRKSKIFARNLSDLQKTCYYSFEIPGVFATKSFGPDTDIHMCQSEQLLGTLFPCIPEGTVRLKIHKKSTCVVEIFLKWLAKFVQVASKIFVTIFQLIILQILDSGLDFYPIMLQTWMRADTFTSSSWAIARPLLLGASCAVGQWASYCVWVESYPWVRSVSGQTVLSWIRVHVLWLTAWMGVCNLWPAASMSVCNPCPIARMEVCNLWLADSMVVSNLWPLARIGLGNVKRFASRCLHC